ncbi:MAG: hypothetical protein GC137_02910 [Alphaproteobacteria bacterium]|nr:hypothetical protein [Alphaproteobacteria bacterium]
MKHILFLVGIGLLAFTPHRAEARPVSYPGGYTAMFMNDGDANSVHLHYSPTAKYSLGYKFEHRRELDINIHALQMNNLLKRWNNEDSQANLYLKSGVGTAVSDDESNPAFYTGVAADWETRRYFVSYENRYLDAGDDVDFYRQSARVGVVPYVGEYGDLHTWLMLQVDHEPEDRNKIEVTPLIRLFKGVHLVEGGISNQGNVLFNWVIRY